MAGIKSGRDAWQDKDAIRVKISFTGEICEEIAFKREPPRPLDVRIAGKQFVAERRSIFD